MQLGIKNKKAVITGGCRGIGLATAKMLCAEGASVCVTGRNQTDLNRTVLEIREQAKSDTCNVFSYCGDLTERKDVEDFTSFIHSVWDETDIVVSNIGNGKTIVANPLDLEEWHRLIKINTDSAVLIADALIDDLRKSRGVMVMVSSIVAQQVFGTSYAYAASKKAIISLVKYMAMSEGKNGVRINCVAPGNVYFEGGRWEEILEEKGESAEGFKEQILCDVPLGRFGTPDDIASMITFLVSERASFITGQCITVDGGQVSGY